MARRDIIVIGTSAGGVNALKELVQTFPADLAASVFVVLHTPPWGESVLPAILSRKGSLPAVHPAHEEPIRPGRIYVAPPDYHLVVEEGRVHLWRGPKENLHRPSINVLFRSAAVTYGRRVVGVLLTGELDDGSAGMWWIKRYGGLAVLQKDAEFPDMPENATQYVEPDYLVPIADIGLLLTLIVNNGSGPVWPGTEEMEPLWKPRNQ